MYCIMTPEKILKYNGQLMTIYSHTTKNWYATFMPFGKKTVIGWITSGKNREKTIQEIYDELKQWLWGTVGEVEEQEDKNQGY